MGMREDFLRPLQSLAGHLLFFMEEIEDGWNGLGLECPSTPIVALRGGRREQRTLSLSLSGLLNYFTL